MRTRRSATKVRNGTGNGKGTTTLARPGDPLVTSDGQILEPDGYGKSAEERFRVKPRSFKAQKKRSLKELPADTGTINGVACVLMYTFLGVPDREIAIALNISLGQVTNIKRHSAYAECFGIISTEFVNANSDLITSRLAAYSHEALDGVYQIAMEGKKENNRLKASMDLLNRGGFTAKEQISKAGMGRQELRITVLEGEVNVDVSHTIGGQDG